MYIIRLIHFIHANENLFNNLNNFNTMPMKPISQNCFQICVATKNIIIFVKSKLYSMFNPYLAFLDGMQTVVFGDVEIRFVTCQPMSLMLRL